MSSSIRFFLSLLIILLAIGVVFLITEPKGELVLILDKQHSPGLDKLFRFVTFLGDGFWFAPLILLFLFIRYSSSAAFAVLGLFQLLLIQGLKRGVFGGVRRPVEYFMGNYELQIVEGIDHYHYYSFPSGHAATAFSIAAMLILLINLNRRTSVVLLFIAALVGISRIYLGQHFLEDVMFGATLGTLSALFVWYIFSGFKRKYPDSKFFKSSLGEVFNRQVR